jgi:hypothetical protein
VLTDGSVCPTLVRKGLRYCGAGAFACQPIFSRLLRERLPRNTKVYWRNGVLSDRQSGNSSEALVRGNGLDAKPLVIR